jgi:hypothetical protein
MIGVVQRVGVLTIKVQQPSKPHIRFGMVCFKESQGMLTAIAVTLISKITVRIRVRKDKPSTTYQVTGLPIVNLAIVLEKVKTPSPRVKGTRVVKIHALLNMGFDARSIIGDDFITHSHPQPPYE